MRAALTLVVTIFVLFCGWLVVESGVFESSSQAGRGPILLQQVAGGEQPQAQAAPQEAPAPTAEQLKAVPAVTFGADNAPAKTIVLGSVDRTSGFEYRVELSSKGAGIRTTTFSKWDDRDYKKPQPLVVISPARRANGSEVLTMANTQLVFVEHQSQLPLDQLEWSSSDVQAEDANSQTARFEAIIKDRDTGEPVLKLTKTYKVSRNSYMLDCDLTLENLSGAEQKVNFGLAGPGGLGGEAYGQDVRQVIAGYRDSRGQIASQSHAIAKLMKAKTLEDRRLEVPGGKLLWVAAVNKYFAAILMPAPDQNKDYCDWVADRTGWFYDPDGDPKTDSGNETLGVDLKSATSTLPAEASKAYRFELYVGPKDKSFFDKNELYRNLGFVQTIDFMGCCCPAWMINPLAFGILAIMKWMHGFWPHNYGIVIIILVFLMRLILHPVTKKSQVSMSKMSKLAPRAEEIKKKYANNKAEMNKQMMALYREQGASPIMGMLPMMVQMPIWIALWSAVYASIDLRGAAFLPFWITDLSAPDALFRFPAFTLPLFGKLDSFNLLPILMGVAFYLQQKLMPSPAATNPQAAQQQKMMQIMLPLMFPLMLYKGPSGVNLYIMASTFAGVLEQHVIRRHIEQKEETEAQGVVSATSKTGGKVKKKKPKPFFKNM
jgi:YidC/Oxa1 family membrane protein insertase